MSQELEARTEVRDGMRITWNQPITVDDGLILRADIFRPIEDAQVPIILTYGIYASVQDSSLASGLFGSQL